ncbi:phosphoadenylyl-sulfate reductase [Candidatus Mycalebacterium sp.]
MKFTREQVEELNRRFEDKGPEEVLSWAIAKLHPKVALATSFQSQGSVVLDILLGVNPGARVFTIDTLRLNPETHETMEKVRQKYGIEVEVLTPDPAEVEEMVSAHGMDLFYKGVENRHLCCGIRKVNPLRKYLSGVDCWITSLRRDQTGRRAEAQKFEIDDIHGGILKINPIVDWTEERVWDYVKSNDVPYNKLYDMGYTSIGCAPCTRAISPGEDSRAGRWWWESDSDKECGIHFVHEETVPGEDKN